MKSRIICGLAVLFLSGVVHGSPAEILARYQQLGAGPFDPDLGRTAWVQEHRPGNSVNPRSCATCHGTDLTRPGKHAKTGKVIEPLAVSANPARVSDAKKVEKWFRRNCRWTLGRECTPQEKGDIVRYIISQ